LNYGTPPPVLNSGYARPKAGIINDRLLQSMMRIVLCNINMLPVLLRSCAIHAPMALKTYLATSAGVHASPIFAANVLMDIVSSLLP
jgi:hypothetical protein